MKTEPIILERTLDAPVSKVWKAITDKNEMKQWYFNLADFKAEIGFTFQFMGGPEEGIQYLHVCEVTEVVNERKLMYSWRYEGYAGISYVSFELNEQGNKTEVRLTHSGIETFPKANPDFAIENFREGWNHILNVSLKDYLEADKMS
ncbi:MAG: SRPBCC domain-containing protein [Bacteroidetes bacterium]|mgnify:FL=1|nr:SRPBCC domain-containing protein [Bacteroidota bacterium]MBP6402212.1 SRPBCC domain-containing protein [Bacteroidia bacterium]MBK6840442.1 SRPBCC domain-containing protein [Bacteroidota bacterium]MBK9524011.1 SRPBCC domain-containing protein [Bacteroidota bacterium]MBK9541753.1 SRPBCC domain-containing protein [Bacteroidota bacterium]